MRVDKILTTSMARQAKSGDTAGQVPETENFMGTTGLTLDFMRIVPLERPIGVSLVLGCR
jgi:hypothetical protein